MTESLYSPSWYRVAPLKPKLRSHAQLHRHHYRDELWYLLQDHSSGRHHRFTPAAYRLIGLMDGSRTVQEIWDDARTQTDAEPPTQEEMIRILSQLHAVDMLQTDVSPDTEELLARFERQQKMDRQKKLGSPLSLRFPLFDPDRFLSRHQTLARLCFSWAGALLWLGVVGSALVLAGMHWAELTENISDRILAPQNLVLLWMVFPVIKAFHEFGHAFAVKVWGGEVHELGVMLLVFTPVPYVDASASSAFRSKRQRVMVGAAGMLAELFIAALAFFVWLNIEPGTPRSIVYNIMIIAGVSTLFFNGNPLLRYDGYYIMSDLLEIPNLDSRGSSYLSYLFQRYFIKIKKLEPPVATRGERRWFFVYAIAAFIYRIFVYAAIILFVAGKFFVVGIALAIWGGVMMLGLPLYRAAKFIFTNTAIRQRRPQTIALLGCLLTLIIALLFLLPFPLWTRAEGVIWIPEQSIVRAGTDGFIDQVLVQSRTAVAKGQPLLAGSDPLLPAEVKVLESKLRELQTQYDAEEQVKRVEAQVILEEMKSVQGKLDRAEERVTELLIRSPGDGTVIVPMEKDLPGRFVKQGEIVAYVVEPASVKVRLVVSQAEVDLVRQRTKSVTVRLLENIDAKIPAVIRREVPGATDKLPSSALGTEGGGAVAIDPRKTGGQTSFQNIFEFELELLNPGPISHYGGRVLVRFDHGYEPVAIQGYRSLRRMFLKRFSV